MQDFRVIDLPERTTLDSSDYTMIDSAENGTNKYLLSRQAAETDAKIATAVGGVEAELDAAVEGIEEDITALQSDVETVETTLETKADKDGTYPDMAVGSVLGTNTVTDKEPYFLRPSASIGDREFDTLVGGSLGWNQLVENGNFADTSVWDGVKCELISVSNNVGLITITGDESETKQFFQLHNLTKDHKMLGVVDVNPSKIATVSFRIGDSSGTPSVLCPANTWTTITNIKNITVDVTNGDVNIYYLHGLANGDTMQIKNCILIDLTTLFGATIADYIYSLEQATAGAGVAWVKKYLPNTYYAYCAPTLKHVSGVSAHVMRDANNNVIGNYAIDSTWVGMGVPKLDSANKLYFDGDRYASDGTVTVKYGIVDLGTLNWNYVSTQQRFYSTDLPNGKSPTSYGTMANIICAKYQTVDFNTITDGNHDKVVAMVTTAQNVVSVRDTAYADAASFKTAMSGVMFVYELATPTTSSASPYTSPQICDPDGTEEYVTTGLVPVGHETEYVENLADKLTDIPNLPTTAGNYHLAVTVDGGVPSYSWVSA